MDIGFKEIDRWHRARGWRMCGYHRVIRRNGEVENGRPIDQSGAHARGYNNRSVGICMAGGVAKDGKTPEDNFTPEQYQSLHLLLTELQLVYPHAKIIGHYGVSPKACPSFDVQEWLMSRGINNITREATDHADELVNELDQHGWLRGSASKASEYIRTNWELHKK